MRRDDSGSFVTDVSGHEFCAIFDFSNYNWKSIALSSGVEIVDDFMDPQLCYDGNGCVYIISNTGQIICYDLDDNKWHVLRKNHFYKRINQFVVWIEMTLFIVQMDIFKIF